MCGYREAGGKPVEPEVETGQKVKAGQLLMKFGVANIRKAGYNIMAPVVVTNHEAYKIEKRSVCRAWF